MPLIDIGSGKRLQEWLSGRQRSTVNAVASLLRAGAFAT